MSNYLTHKHKARIKALIEKIALDIVKQITEEGDLSAQDFSALYELQDHLGDYSIGDFGITYPDESNRSVKQMILDLDAKSSNKQNSVNEHEKKDPWNLGE